jgi:hypothetical protein
MRVMGGLLKNSPARIAFNGPRLTCKALSSAAGSAPGKSTMMRSGPEMAWVSGAIAPPEVRISTSIAPDVPRTKTRCTRAGVETEPCGAVSAWEADTRAGVCAERGMDTSAAKATRAPVESRYGLATLNIIIVPSKIGPSMIAATVVLSKV